MVLWTPDQEEIKNSAVYKLQRKHGFRNYSELHAYSVDEPNRFWLEMLDELDIQLSERPRQAFLQTGHFKDTVWFPGAKLNFAENLLKHKDNEPAVLFAKEDEKEPLESYTYLQLHQEVSRRQQLFRADGIAAGDRIAAVLPNMPETVFSMLAATASGAVFSTCSPDFGVQGITDRFSQIDPKILIACDSYMFKGRRIDTTSLILNAAEKIPSIEKIYFVSFNGSESSQSFALAHAEWMHEALTGIQGESVDFSFQAGFDHPVYIMYSSGTTGLPKCMVQGPGVMLNHKKEHVYHTGLKRQDKIFYFTTCGWMMWNWLVGALSAGACIVLFDGNPFYPDPGRLWRLAEKARINVFGTSARYLAYLEKTGYKITQDISSVRMLLSTGSPLLPEQYDFVYEQISDRLHLASISGGTDLNGCFVLGNPVLPVRRGEIQCAGLGMDVHVYDEEGNETQGEGELVCKKPFPSMPLYFQNDPDGSRYYNAYFSKYDNVWRHGDYMRKTEEGGFVISGRSDATLNPGGVRIVTADIYRVVESKFSEIEDSLIIGQSYKGDVRVILFVKMKEDCNFDEDLVKRLKSSIRKDASPRHVPAVILQAGDIPYTRSMKKLELAVKNIFENKKIKNMEAVSNPECLAEYEKIYRSLN